MIESRVQRMDDNRGRTKLPETRPTKLKESPPRVSELLYVDKNTCVTPTRQVVFCRFELYYSMILNCIPIAAQTKKFYDIEDQCVEKFKGFY